MYIGYKKLAWFISVWVFYMRLTSSHYHLTYSVSWIKAAERAFWRIDLFDLILRIFSKFSPLMRFLGFVKTKLYWLKSLSTLHWVGGAPRITWASFQISGSSNRFLAQYANTLKLLSSASLRGWFWMLLIRCSKEAISQDVWIPFPILCERKSFKLNRLVEAVGVELVEAVGWSRGVPTGSPSGFFEQRTIFS